jgi:hypothetical protein
MTEPPQEPSPDGPPKIWLGALEFNPQIASLLGIYIAELTQFEWGLIAFFARVIGTSFNTAKTIFGRIMSISIRIDIISDCIDTNIDPPSNMELLTLADKAKAINATRNKYVHGTYRTNQDSKEVILTTWLLESGRNSRHEPLSAEMLRQDINSLRSFNGDLFSLFSPDLEFPHANDKPPLP